MLNVRIPVILLKIDRWFCPSAPHADTNVWGLPVLLCDIDSFKALITMSVYIVEILYPNLLLLESMISGSKGMGLTLPEIMYGLCESTSSQPGYTRT